MTTTAPSGPAFSAIWRSGSSSARRTIFAPVSSSPSSSFVEVDRLRRDQRDAAAGDDAFLDRGAGGVQGVLDRAFFSFISVSVAAPTLICGDAAGQLREALLELLAVVVAVGGVDLG